MFHRRRGHAALPVLLAAALSLTACGSSSGGSSADEKGPEAAETAKSSVAVGGKDFSEAADRTAAMGTAAKPGEFPRTITHALGTTEIPARPERVVVLDVGELDNVVSLGVKPVGYAPTEGSPELPSYLKQDAGSPKNVGTINNLNLEAIAALKPDLILGSQLRAADKYRALAKIAPTVFSIRPGFTWKQNYLLNAASLDRTTRAEARLAEYEKEADALGERLGADKPSVTMVRFMPGKIRLYAKQSFIGTILEDVGVPRPRNQQADTLAVEVSPERIDEADADFVFTGVYGAPDKTSRTRTRTTPLWKSLRAVKDGHAFDVSDETWYLGLGVTAAEEVLGDLEGFLVGG